MATACVRDNEIIVSNSAKGRSPGVSVLDSRTTLLDLVCFAVNQKEARNNRVKNEPLSRCMYLA